MPLTVTKLSKTAQEKENKGKKGANALRGKPQLQ